MVKRNNLEIYDQFAGSWWNPNSQMYPLSYLNQPRFEFCDRYIADWRGLRVLDVGCGGGYTCEFLAAKQAIVSGIDQSQVCIDAAKIHAQSQGYQIDYQQGVAENMPYPDASFDAVICVDVLEHIADLQSTISEIHRILKPQGLFFFDTINRNFKSQLIMISLLEDILRKIPQGVHDWNKFIKPEELIPMMYQTGFSQVEVKGFDFLTDIFSLDLGYHWEVFTTGKLKIRINEDTSLMYIGKAMKLS